MIAYLSPDQIFPVTKLRGRNVETKTGLKFSGTLQGEGKLAGVPSLFIRFSGCNLRCSWHMADGTVDICDTPYASHRVLQRIPWEVSDIVDEVLENTEDRINHIVITGGEPTLQAAALTELAAELKHQGFHITVETNGTMFDARFAKYVDLFSISPKLSSSNPVLSPEEEGSDNVFAKHQFTRKANESLKNYIAHCQKTYTDYQLKFVVADEKDEQEIKQLIDSLSDEFVDPDQSKVYLMPLGSTSEILAKSRLFTAEIAIKNGWRFSPRIHVDVFGNKSGT